MLAVDVTEVEPAEAAAKAFVVEDVGAVTTGTSIAGGRCLSSRGAAACAGDEEEAADSAAATDKKYACHSVDTRRVRNSGCRTERQGAKKKINLCATAHAAS